MNLRCIMHGVAAGAIAFACAGVAAQDYPHKPIRLIAAAPGGTADFVARVLSQELSGTIGQQVILDNRGIIAGELVAKAPADGYTLLFYGSPLWIIPLLRQTSDGPLNDLAPITLAVSSIDILAAHPAVGAKSVKELIAIAKARPGELNYSSGSSGGAAHLESELLKAMTGTQIVRIPFKGNGPAFNALMGNQVQIMFANVSQIAPHLGSGRLIALGVTSPKPSALAPGVPPIAATVPGFEAYFILGVFAPAKTPPVLIDRLNRESVRVLTKPDVKQKLFGAGIEVVASSPREFADTIKSEVAKWGKVIRDAGIREE